MQKEYAFHGFSIIEIRGSTRITCFPNRSTVRKYSVCKMRIMDLVRDRKYSHLPSRIFEVWDGITPVTKFEFIGSNYTEKPYLIPASNAKEQADLDKDYFLSIKSRRNNQKTGPTPGDITAWTVAGPKDRVLCKMGFAAAYIPKEIANRNRTFGSKELTFPVETKNIRYINGIGFARKLEE